MAKRYYELTKEERWEIEKDGLFKSRHSKVFNAIGTYEDQINSDESPTPLYQYISHKIDHADC